MTVKERIIGLESFMAPIIIDFRFFWFKCIASRRGIKEDKFSGSIHQQQGTVVKSFKVSTEKRFRIHWRYTLFPSKFDSYCKFEMSFKFLYSSLKRAIRCLDKILGWQGAKNSRPCKDDCNMYSVLQWSGTPVHSTVPVQWSVAQRLRVNQVHHSQVPTKCTKNIAQGSLN